MKPAPISQKTLFILLLFFVFSPVQSQNQPDTIQASLYDMGKMWTFDYPPTSYFSKTYGISADNGWFEKARLSALRLGGGCSASFVSKDGLVMTNQHCARGYSLTCQLAGRFSEKRIFLPN